MKLTTMLAVVGLATLPLLAAAPLAHAASARESAAESPATIRASVASDGTQANARSLDQRTSADGRYVAYSSAASNLVPGDTNGESDIFVHDRVARTTTRVSVANDGSQADNASYSPVISADGRHIAFTSFAHNIAPEGASEHGNIFVYDQTTRQATLVSRSRPGTVNRGGAWSPSISADGRFIAYQSRTRDVVPGDTNRLDDVFVFDQSARKTTRVSVGSDGAQGDGPSELPAISGNGRFVTFGSAATNLVAGDTNGERDVFVHDRASRQTTRISVAGDGSQGNRTSHLPAISATGRYISYWSRASTLVADDTNGTADVFLYDRRTAKTARVSLSLDGGQSAQDADVPSISANGRFVTFRSYTWDTTARARRDIGVRVYDRKTGKVVQVTSVVEGEVRAFCDSPPDLSGDGKYVAFCSAAPDVVPGDTNDAPDVYLAPVVWPTPAA